MAQNEKELTQAANALIEWFNTQELSKSDARSVMNKVTAKILIGETTDYRKLRDLIDIHSTSLELELVRRLRHVLDR